MDVYNFDTKSNVNSLIGNNWLCRGGSVLLIGQSGVGKSTLCVQFMLKEPFDDTDRIFETKLDGYRAIVVIDSTGKARIWSRNTCHSNRSSQPLGTQSNQLKLRSTILDGGIVALDNDGIPKFQLLQRWQKLVCEVAFAEWTEDGELRQTTFLGWRDDKSPEEVVLEIDRRF